MSSCEDESGIAYWFLPLLLILRGNGTQNVSLHIQLDLPDRGIWGLENDVSLPDSRKTWQFSLLSPHSPLPLSSPGRVLSTGSTKMQSYFLAEIAMRRVLRRCTTCVRTGRCC
jgi:hypothetical protein